MGLVGSIFQGNWLLQSSHVVEVLGNTMHHVYMVMEYVEHELGAPSFAEMFAVRFGTSGKYHNIPETCPDVTGVSWD